MPAMRRPRSVMMIEEGGIGGVADYTVALVSALAACGQSVDLITAADHTQIPIDGVQSFAWFHYLRPTTRFRKALRSAHLGPILNGWGFLFTYLRCVARARRHSRLVHIQGGTSVPLTLFAVLLFRLTGTPVVHTPHNTFTRAGDIGWGRRWLERLSSRTIVHAAADLENLEDPDAAAVIPHGEYAGLAAGGQEVDRDHARSQLGIPADAPATLIFGQLREDKGIGDVLTAAATIPGLFVLIAGQEVGGLAAASEALGDERLRDRVVVREGFVSIDEAAVCFAAADTVTLAYRQASHSGVLMLSYGFSRPVIVYPSGGLPEAVVDGRTGWVCERPDPESLAAALRDSVALGSEECLRRGEAGADLARSRYSWDEIARETLALYDGLAPPAASGAG